MSKAKKTPNAPVKNPTNPVPTIVPKVDDIPADSNGGNTGNGGDPVAVKPKGGHSKEVHESMKPYVAAYPDAIAFLIATDGQVFLKENEQDAKVHQNSLGDTKGLVVYFP